MTARESTYSLSQPAQLKRAAVLTWLEFPRVFVIGALGILLALPLLTALLGVPWPIVALAALPVCLYATGFARFATRISAGGRPSIREALRADVVLGFTIEAGLFATVALLSSGRATLIPGVLLSALLLLVVPFALSYGAVRERVGFSAWRGGLILVAFRPGTALTILALNCIGAFAVVASLGTFGLFVPCVLCVFTCAVVADQLDDIDRRSGTR